MHILQVIKKLKEDIVSWVTLNINALNAKIDSKTVPIDDKLDPNSTNPVQNKVINSKIADINNRVGITSVASQIDNAINNLEVDYNDLINAPNIETSIDAEENEVLEVVDKEDQIVVRIDKEGITTTAVTIVDGENSSPVATKKYVDEEISKATPEGYATTKYVDDAVAEHASEVKGELQDINDTIAGLGDEIVSNQTELKIVDTEDKIIFQVDGNGVTTTDATITNNLFGANISAYNIIADSIKVDENTVATENWVEEQGYAKKATDLNFISTAEKGQKNGIAELDSQGFVLSSQLPSYVDDVIEGTYNAETGTFTIDGEVVVAETDKIYVDIVTNKTYRWSGSIYVAISSDLALGETELSAYRGDRGKIAYEHSQITKGNPHGIDKETLGLENVDNTSDADKPISNAVQEKFDEMSKTIVTEETEWLVVDLQDQIVARIDEKGLETTKVQCDELWVNGNQITGEGGAGGEVTAETIIIDYAEIGFDKTEIIEFLQEENNNMEEEEV